MPSQDKSNPTGELHVAAIQMVSGTNIQTNLITASRLINEAAQSGAKLVVLPEFFTIMGRKDSDKLKWIERHGSGLVQDFLQAQAKKHQIVLIGGTHAIASNHKDKPFSRCYVYGADGNCLTWYDKIHLFDVSVNDATGNYCESRYSTPGNQIATFTFEGVKIGLAVCYDLRFPELFRQLVDAGCQLFCLPAAFTETTGKAHWEILLKARAIENQAYMIASAQGGLHENGRATWGQSCIISPQGSILNELPKDEGFISYSIDLSSLEKLRSEFPVLTHTRL